MKDLTISLPDEIYDSVVEMLKKIPNVSLDENEEIPEWHKNILNERFKEFEQKPKEGITLNQARILLFPNG
jgi:Putative addiction module component